MNKTEVIEQHYRKNRDSLVKIFSRRCGGIDNAEDVVQEGFCRALQYKATLDPDREIGPWFNSILNNALRDFQKEFRLQGGTTTVDVDDEEIEGGEASQYDKERADEVKAVIENTGGMLRRILDMYFFLNYPPRDICRVIDVKNKTVRMAIWRFKNLMREGV